VVAVLVVVLHQSIVPSIRVVREILQRTVIMKLALEPGEAILGGGAALVIAVATLQAPAVLILGIKLRVIHFLLAPTDDLPCFNYLRLMPVLEAR